MTRRAAYARVAMVLAVALGALAILVHQLRDSEMFVYVALAQSITAIPGGEKVALVSAPADCDVPKRRAEYMTREEIQDLARRNRDAPTRDLSRLKTLMLVVPDDRARYMQKTGALLVRAPQGISYLHISRVGFDSTRSTAVICASGEIWGGLFYFERGIGPFWKQVGDEVLWVS